MRLTVEYRDRMGRVRKVRTTGDMADVADNWPEWAERHLGDSGLTLVSVSGGWQ